MCYDIFCEGGIAVADFENRLKSLRNENSLNQSEVAEELGIARTTYANYEQGKRFPGKENLIAIAEYFGVSIDYLLGETDEKQSADKVINEISKDEELLEFYNAVKENNELKKLFKHSKNLSSKSIKQIVQIIKTFEETKDN